MVRTRVGYAGGSSTNPTYYNLSGHSETIQIDFDPSRISYGDLLDVFWSNHNPAQRSYSRQYASIIFANSEEQERVARESKERQENQLGRTVYTEIVSDWQFYPAEDYHQKYYLQGYNDLSAQLRSLFQDENAFVNSTAVARVNGYLGGNGGPDQLDTEIDKLGLPPAGQERLRSLVR